VGKSLGIAERKNNPDLNVDNATVQLYENGALRQSLTYEPTMQSYVSSVMSEPGKQYSVKVTAPSYSEASAASSVPSAVPINNFSRITNARTDENGDPQDALLFTFDDPAAPGDYYIIKISQAEDTFGYWQGSFCVNSADASIETVGSESVDLGTCLDNNYIFMRDELFNGKQKQVKLYVSQGNLNPTINGADTSYPRLELIHVPEAYFRFEKSRQAADYANGDPFSEPVNVYTNVANGYGIFSILSREGLFIK
jgi:hypothetical protein